MEYPWSAGAQPNLVWSPTHFYIESQLRSGEELRMIVAPFIRKNALLSLLDGNKTTNMLCVITRWTGQDIVSGVSDIDIYPLLEDRGIALYLNQTIHLKLLVFASNWAFVTSGNITEKGMGLTQPCNLEIGCRTELGREDWKSIYQLLGASFRVDANIYRKATVFRNENSKPPSCLPPLELGPSQNPPFSILSLPATDSPSKLFALYSGAERKAPDSVNAFMHDIALYDILPGMAEDVFHSYLRERFRSQQFNQAIVELIKAAGSARFGLVNEWLQSNCSDKPTPYRWELKPATRRLFNWLVQFYDEISWDRPRYSMIIRWKG